MPLVGRYIDRKLIDRVGRRCSWEQAILAPQQRADGQQDYSVGDVRGYLYAPAQTFKILVHGDNRDENFSLQGAWEKGSCEGTVPAHRDVGDQDRITILDYPVRDAIQLVRGATSRDVIRQHSVLSLGLLTDGSTFYQVGAAFQLYTDANGVSYVEWLADAPPEGTRYTVLMQINTVWVVTGHPMVRGFSGKSKDRLPYRCSLKRYDFSVVGGA